jgi:hypothetical protein
MRAGPRASRASENDGIDALYNAGNSVAEYRHRHQLVETFGGWSAGLVNGWTRRYSIGVLHENNQYALEPGKAAPERLPSDLKLVGPFVRFQLVQDEFRQDMNLNLIGRVEDFAMGIQANAQLGYAFESLDRRAILAIPGKHKQRLRHHARQLHAGQRLRRRPLCRARREQLDRRPGALLPAARQARRAVLRTVRATP